MPMYCFECICTLPIFFLRFFVWMTPCCFKHKHRHKHAVDVQLQLTLSKLGGWYSSYYRDSIHTRDTFYVLLGLRLRRKGQKELEKFLQRLADNMSNEGQVPARFTYSWWRGEQTHYTSLIKQVPIIDSNIFFLVMVWWLHEKNPRMIKGLYLHCQRAYNWLETYLYDDIIHEPNDASWETTLKHKGYTLLTNILAIQAIRSMELIAMVQKDTLLQEACVERHGKFVTKWQPELYRTQEVLPRILAIHWSIITGNFLLSFNQELQSTWVPLRTSGPVVDEVTSYAWKRGRSDMHTTVVWPFVGFLWIAILTKRMKTGLAKKWWDSYIDFHHPQTLYDMYSKETGMPIHRAFLTAVPTHSVTISMYMAASQAISGLPI